MSVLVGLFSLFHKFGGILVCEVPPCLFIGHTPAYVSCDTCQRHKGPGECRNRQTPCRHSSSTGKAFLALLKRLLEFSFVHCCSSDDLLGVLGCVCAVHPFAAHQTVQVLYATVALYNTYDSWKYAHVSMLSTS